MGVLEGKVAIVTGGGGGIGRAVVQCLAQEGARVVVGDLGCDAGGRGRDPQVAMATAEMGAVACDADVGTPGGAQALVRRAVESFGTVDVLVTAAGIVRAGTLAEVGAEDFDAVVQAQLRGALLCTQAVAPVLSAKGCGRIVYVVGHAGLIGAFGQLCAGMVEAGTMGLMRGAAIELERHGIFVNAVAAVARTRQNADVPESVSVEHVAPAVLFLASDLAGDRTGTILAVTGGRVSTYEMAGSRGSYKAGVPWTAAEIGEHWGALSKR